MEVILLATCINCDGAKALKDAARTEGYIVRSETVKGSDSRTIKSASLGIGLPVLIREDGAYSDDAINWLGVKKRVHVTNPLEVVEDAYKD